MSKLLLLLTFVLFSIISCQSDFNKTVTSLQDALDALKFIQKQKTEIQRLFNDFKAHTNIFNTNVISNVKEDIRTQGFCIGNRWKIFQEGNALVLKDITFFEKYEKRRFAMYCEKYRDK